MQTISLQFKQCIYINKYILYLYCFIFLIISRRPFFIPLKNIWLSKDPIDCSGEALEMQENKFMKSSALSDYVAKSVSLVLERVNVFDSLPFCKEASSSFYFWAESTFWTKVVRSRKQTNARFSKLKKRVSSGGEKIEHVLVIQKSLPQRINSKPVHVL